MTIQVPVSGAGAAAGAAVAPRPFRLASFFAGIGGFDLGFERAGFESVFHCEINPFCQKVLERHWPDSMLRGDIVNDVTAAEIPNADVWAAGFPCQDVSVARGAKGRAGLDGARSGLFFRFAELVEERLPRAILLENVQGLLNSNEGRDFRLVLDRLLGLGYGVAWRVVNSRYFGAPQSRPRTFIVASYGTADIAAHALFEPEGSKTPAGSRAGFITPDDQHTGFPVVPRVGYCLAATSGRHTGTDWSRSYVSYKDRVRRLTPTECEGLQGFPVGWTLLPGDAKLDPDEIDTARYHALGNAVTVDVVRWVAARLKQSLEEAPPRITPMQTALAIDATERARRYVESLSKAEPAFRTKKAQPLQLTRLHGVIDQEAKYKWATGGVAFATSGVQGRPSAAPAEPVMATLGDIIQRGKVRDRYFLSPNAAEGILRRVKSQNRTLFGPLHDALEKLAQKEG
ncbi:MAG: DNA (cytosine-5-)-methyltransferase [Proteobacteria bacterium]|nr:DNA (cytosine-5-)-methyltransferase [Pseudomonadota bacterium]